MDIWELIEDLVSGGTTLLLTTQYLEEADFLADTIGVIDQGLLIAEGTSDDLKQTIGGVVIELHVPADDRDRATVILRDMVDSEPMFANSPAGTTSTKV